MNSLKFAIGLIASAAATVPTAASAQDENTVVVTGSRSTRASNFQYYDNNQAAIGYTRKADYFVTPIFVNSDSRSEELRREELLAMLRATIERAEREGISLVAGDYELMPLTAENLDELPILGGGRPDTSRVTFYARVPVQGATSRADAAMARIAAFTKAVPVTGRSFIETGSTSLALNNPDQYRIEVVRAVAEESRRYAALFGNDYGIEIRGLDSELFWQQASETDVFLYITHSFVIRPK